MNMREQFVKTTNEFLEKNERVAVLLGGISVASFQNSIEQYPYRVFNAGISEQAIVSMASGMSIAGMIPVVHSIAPFLVERAFEQLKLDFGYQKQRGNFVSTGASLDYSSFGATHQCPGDVALLKQIEGMQILVPGTAEEFKILYEEAFENDYPTYYRLSRDVNKKSENVSVGKANVVQQGKLATVIAVGPMLDMVKEACSDLDVTILYYTSLAPFDGKTLIQNLNAAKILLCEPFYMGCLLKDIIEAVGDAVEIKEIGIPITFSSHYGYTVDHYYEFGMTKENIREQVKNMIEE